VGLAAARTDLNGCIIANPLIEIDDNFREADISVLIDSSMSGSAMMCQQSAGIVGDLVTSDFITCGEELQVDRHG
jgi:hypothetical protein